jgi:tRNA(fMet)-specific endonuclease VapC
VTIRFILDTNVVSALMKSEPWVVARMAAVLPVDLGIPQPVIAELFFGIDRLPRSRRRASLAMQLEKIRAVVPRLAWTDDVSRRFGDTKAHLQRIGRLIEDFDVAIAAHALSLDAVLVTANVDHMKRVPGLRVEDWE